MAILWDFFSVFPANAGMILFVRVRKRNCVGVPRECGDDPKCADFEYSVLECSPRMRG